MNTKSMSLYLTAFLLLSTLKTSAQNTFPATGNVGIGTVSPLEALEVRGNIKQATGGYLSNVNDNIGVVIRTSRSDNTQIGQLSTNGWGAFSFNKGLGIGYDLPSNNSGSQLLVNGNVGIGTTSPSNKLTVNGDGRFEQGVFAPSVGFRVVPSATDMVNNATWYGLGATNTSLTGAPAGAVVPQLAGYWGISLVTGGGGQLTLLKGGNVGIGTLNPKARLSVDGNILAREVKVTVDGSDWADYVFDKGYKLPSLDLLSKHIEKLGHLPGMPSAQDVKKNGIDLGEMNRKLLEKVEELTLYIVQQEKRIKALEQKTNSK